MLSLGFKRKLGYYPTECQEELHGESGSLELKFEFRKNEGFQRGFL